MTRSIRSCLFDACKNGHFFPKPFSWYRTSEGQKPGQEVQASALDPHKIRPSNLTDTPASPAESMQCRAMTLLPGCPDPLSMGYLVCLSSSTLVLVLP